MVLYIVKIEYIYILKQSMQEYLVITEATQRHEQKAAVMQEFQLRVKKEREELVARDTATTLDCVIPEQVSQDVQPMSVHEGFLALQIIDAATDDDDDDEDDDDDGGCYTFDRDNRVLTTTIITVNGSFMATFRTNDVVCIYQHDEKGRMLYQFISTRMCFRFHKNIAEEAYDFMQGESVYWHEKCRGDVGDDGDDGDDGDVGDDGDDGDVGDVCCILNNVTGKIDATIKNRKDRVWKVATFVGVNFERKSSGWYRVVDTEQIFRFHPDIAESVERFIARNSRLSIKYRPYMK